MLCSHDKCQNKMKTQSLSQTIIYKCTDKENYDWHMESDTYDNIRMKIPQTVKNIKDGKNYFRF